MRNWLLLALLVSINAQAGAYQRCAINGETVFTDKPCPESAEASRTIKIDKAPPAPETSTPTPRQGSSVYDDLRTQQEMERQRSRAAARFQEEIEEDMKPFYAERCERYTRTMNEYRDKQRTGARAGTFEFYKEKEQEYKRMAEDACEKAK